MSNIIVQIEITQDEWDFISEYRLASPQQKAAVEDALLKAGRARIEELSKQAKERRGAEK